MSKPDDIPQDVWDKAKEIVFTPYLMEWEGIAAVGYAILAAKAEERQVFVDMIEQFGSAKLITHCRAAIRKRGEG
jgi:sugar/nucleoside kinase (ribokinase family)